ncbi:hypothetical protein [Flammeovirga sp. SubArs3]|uniref:hypothetical protein n=1 Tax=Flammeovirga sp. SubArs3 TaxID=2995316 RepID=UPI00248CF2A2|nr:hypothetical protein [Flammeovirga sp. SubArs3]
MNTLEQIQQLNSDGQKVDVEYILDEDHYDLLMDLAEAETDDEEEEIFKQMEGVPNLPIMASVIELWENTVGAVMIYKEFSEGTGITMSEKSELEEELCGELSNDFSRFTVIINNQVVRVQVKG